MIDCIKYCTYDTCVSCEVFWVSSVRVVIYYVGHLGIFLGGLCVCVCCRRENNWGEDWG